MKRKGMDTTVNMKFYWNKEAKRLVVVFVIILFMGCLLSRVVITRYCNMINREFNLAVASMLDTVNRSYPGASEEELLVLMSENADSGVGERLLGQYGVFLEEKGSSFAGLKGMKADFCKMLTAVLLFTGGSSLVILFVYLRHRQKEIGKLCSYMDEMGKGNFCLDILYNRDDELSSLKNELYKLTIFLKEQAKTAMENRKALANAVADISHQLKTPLTSVTVLVDNLSENQDMDPSVRSRFLREISNQLSGMTWLTATLLKLSRLDAGVVELECRPLSVKALMEKVCHKLELAAELRQVKLRLQIPEDIWLMGDEHWLAEAMLNLVKNAVEHSSEGEEVQIIAEENDVYICLTVRDCGEGIGPEDQKHLFERFYRGCSAGEDSVGIGLSLAKEIIVRQEGYITVESDKEQGTTFIIKFIKCH